MDPATLAAIITTAGGMANTGFSLGASSNLNKKNRRWQEKMYGIQSADTLAQWNRNNEYNSPSAQMARYKAAGLNPNLLYGMENLSAPTSTLGTPGTPQTFMPTSDIRADAFLQARQLQLENRKLDIEEKRVNKQNEVDDATIRQIFKGFDLTDAQIAEKRSIVEMNIKTLDEIDANIALLNERKKAQFLENLYNEQTMKDRVSLLQSEAKIKSDEASLFLEMQKAIIEEKLGNAAAARASVAQYQATARKLNFEVENIMPSLKVLYDNQANKEDKLAAIADIEGKIKNAFGYDQAQADIISKLLSGDTNLRDMVHKTGNGKLRAASWIEDKINSFTYQSKKK